ncbi:MAG: hypothetical protein LBN25_02705 [Christensenellaceae bacterium]|nr:hypothetical protein [Christensenellaceae bacterium]
MKRNFDGGVPRQAGKASVFCDENVLSFDFECEEQNVVARGAGYNADIWEGDVYEVMIRLDCPCRYLEASVNASNTAYCVIIENDGKGAFKIERRLPEKTVTHSCRAEGGTVRATLKFEIKALQSLGMPAGTPVFNVFRQDFDESGELHLSAANPTGRKTFHIPQSFFAF